jgi:hypothetical protein
MADRTFTLSEAQTLVPVLESLLRSAMEGKKTMQEVETELQEVGQRIFVNGGMLVDVIAISKRKAQRDKAVQTVKDALGEIDSAGVQVKDLDIGLLDFPCVVEDRVILLCWKLGEPGIGFWHGTEEGFAGRKPIDEKIINARKQKRPN